MKSMPRVRKAPEAKTRSPNWLHRDYSSCKVCGELNTTFHPGLHLFIHSTTCIRVSSSTTARLGGGLPSQNIWRSQFVYTSILSGMETGGSKQMTNKHQTKFPQQIEKGTLFMLLFVRSCCRSKHQFYQIFTLFTFKLLVAETQRCSALSFSCHGLEIYFRQHKILCNH